MKQHDWDTKRRHVLRNASGGLAGFVASALLPWGVSVPRARAAIVTPNPIGTRIKKSGIAV